MLLFLCCKWFFESSVAWKNFLSFAQVLYPPPTRISLTIHNYSIEFLFLQHLMSLFDNLSELSSGYLLFVGRTRRITQSLTLTFVAFEFYSGLRWMLKTLCLSEGKCSSTPQTRFKGPKVMRLKAHQSNPFAKRQKKKAHRLVSLCARAIKKIFSGECIRDLNLTKAHCLTLLFSSTLFGLFFLSFSLLFDKVYTCSLSS